MQWDGWVTAPLIFPSSGPTRLLVDPSGEQLPVVRAVGALDGVDPAGALAAAGRRGCSLLIEQARGSFDRPGLRGHRLDGGAWSPAFVRTGLTVTDERLVVEAEDEVAGLALRTEIEALAGGAIRARHVLTNTGDTPYVVDGLELTVPVPDRCTELLDFTGRHERERTPQRHTMTDGLWLREVRRGRTSLESPTLLVAGTPGFGFGHGSVLGVHVADSGNSVLRAERSPQSGATIGGGELLLPGEVRLGAGESYAMPWLVVTAGTGLDDLAAAAHTWQRTFDAHPAPQPVTLNVWEAVYFDHDLDRLLEIAERASRIGVERFVLDDGWFHGRRNDHAGLGDWWVDEDVWPNGLDPLISRVTELGMQFGLWFEPEMVNPDSELFRKHPDWILQAGDRMPLPHRHQQVLDLTNDEAWTHVRDQIDAVLSAHAIRFVKWDHNRDLLEAGSNVRGGAAAAREQNLAYYRLLDDLRARHPQVSWESCASGGGRVDMGVLEHVQRVWTSDMTDALSRQQIQRWTAQIAAPEYLGAHISAPASHQTGRTLSLDFRAATALFGSFGIEWDVTQASEDDLDKLAGWVDRYKRYRSLLQTGRMVRLDVADDAVLAHGVIAPDGSTGLLAHVQLDESATNRGVELRIPGLRPDARYAVRWEGPAELKTTSYTTTIDPDGPTGGVSVRGATLAEVGLWLPRCRPETIRLIHISAVE
jgi:alpha-galactosidase